MTITVPIMGDKSLLLAQEGVTDAYCAAIKQDCVGRWGGLGGSQQQFTVSNPVWGGSWSGSVKKTTTKATKC